MIEIPDQRPQRKRFAAMLDSVMIVRDLSNTEVAGLCGVTEKQVYGWRTGIYWPPLFSFYKLCISLNVSADVLLGIKIDPQLFVGRIKE